MISNEKDGIRKKGFLVQISKNYEKYRYEEELWRSLEAILTLVTIILLGFLAIRPTIRAITDLIAEINNKKELSEKMETKIKQIREAQVLYAQVQPEIFLLDQYYPIDLQISLGFAQLAGLAQEQGLAINGLSLKEIDYQKLPLALDFSFSVAGNYQQNKDFLSSLYQTRRGLIFKSYSMSKGGKAEDEEIVTSLLGQLLFFRKDE